ncbi:MAG TPA: N-6 DNA methylase [Armatimonadota bacterium]|nr:N-6 DNA methylase [Armatimonadota bacterium]
MSEFDTFCSRIAGAAAVAAAGLAPNDPAGLIDAYRSGVRFALGLLAAFMLESKEIDEARTTCSALRSTASDQGSWESAVKAFSTLGKVTGVHLIKAAAGVHIPAKNARAVLQLLTGLDTDAVLGPIYFESIPPAWVSTLYERLLDLKPNFSPEPPGVVLKPDSGSRKRSGSFFTPSYIIDYIVKEALGEKSGSPMPRVLDPSMGPGDFLLRSAAFLAQKGLDPTEVAENCLYGCDIDPIAVDLSRFLVWFTAEGKADAAKIAQHLICADALDSGDRFRWHDAFPDAFSLFSGGSGFDAVIGNPPYVAAKNGGVIKKPVRGQSDYYLLFLESVIENELVKAGGTLAMVLPDPFLVRSNAAHIRRELLDKWKITSIVHIAGAFPSAQVANVVLVCSNSRPDSSSFPVVRLDKASLQRRFEVNPKSAVSLFACQVDPRFALAQKRAEVLYLVDSDRWQSTFMRIHGPEMSLAKIAEPFIFLKDIGVEVVFRGEEIGKRAISVSDGDLPILLGGQSIKPYRIIWEGNRIEQEDIVKPLKWYSPGNILLQKSSSKLVAAFDEYGFIVPQSIYGIKLREDSPYHPLYLLAIMNSTFMNDYVFRAFTGYKLVQPQIELEDVKHLPIRSIPFELNPDEREKLAKEGQSVFESELSNRAGESPQLTALAQNWIASDKPEAVHDLLVYMAKMAIRHRQNIYSSEILLDQIDRMIDSVVEVLYNYR